MDHEIFKIAGAVAGIGGIALAAVIFIFREIIRKEIFPRLTKGQGYRLLNRIVVLTFVIGVLGIVAYLLINLRNGTNYRSNNRNVEQKPATRQSLSGIVVDQNKKPLQGARVTLREFPGMTPVTTSSDGVFNLTDISRESGDRVRLKVVMEGYAPSPYEDDAVLGKDYPPPEIVLTKKQ